MAGFMDSLAGGVGSAVAGSIADKIIPSKQPSGNELGKQQRDYLDAAFPELNPWEKAGAPSTGSSTATAALSSQERIGKRNNSTTAGAAAAQLKQQEKLVDAQVQTQNTTAEKNRAEVGYIKAKTHNEQAATSSFGKSFKDATNIGKDIYNGVKSTVGDFISPSKTKSLEQNNQNTPRLSINMKNSAKSRRLYKLQEQLIKATTKEQKQLIQKRINELQSK